MKKPIITLMFALFFQSFLLSQNDSLEKSYLTAEKYYRNSKYEKAIEFAKVALEINEGSFPNNEYIQSSIGLIFHAQSKFDSARHYYNAVLSNPNFVFEKEFREKVERLYKKAVLETSFPLDENDLESWFDLKIYSPEWKAENSNSIEIPLKTAEDKNSHTGKTNSRDTQANETSIFSFIKEIVFISIILVVVLSLSFRFLIKKLRSANEGERKAKLELEKLEQFKILEESPYHQGDKTITLTRKGEPYTFNVPNIVYVVKESNANFFWVYFKPEVGQDKGASTKLKRLDFNGSLDKLELLLPPSLFLRCGQSNLINILEFNIKSFGREAKAILKSDEKTQLDVSRDDKKKWMEIVNKWNNPLEKTSKD